MIHPEDAEKMLRKFLSSNFDSWEPKQTKSELLKLAWEYRPESVRKALNDPRSKDKFRTKEGVLDLFYHTDGACLVGGKVIVVDVTVNEAELNFKRTAISEHRELMQKIGIQGAIVLHWTIKKGDFDDLDILLFEKFEKVAEMLPWLHLWVDSLQF